MKYDRYTEERRGRESCERNCNGRVGEVKYSGRAASEELREVKVGEERTDEWGVIKGGITGGRG